MRNFDLLLQSVEDKMDVSQDFTDSPRICILFSDFLCFDISLLLLTVTLRGGI